MANKKTVIRIARDVAAMRKKPKKNKRLAIAKGTPSAERYQAPRPRAG